MGAFLIHLLFWVVIWFKWDNHLITKLPTRLSYKGLSLFISSHPFLNGELPEEWTEGLKIICLQPRSKEMIVLS